LLPRKGTLIAKFKYWQHIDKHTLIFGLAMSNPIVRTKIMQIRVSEVEFEMIHSRASQAGLSCSELFRRNALLRPLPKRTTKIAVQTYVELGKIGNNINQLTKAVNTAMPLATSGIALGQKPRIDVGQLEALGELLHQIRREITGCDKSQLGDGEDWDEEDEF
jgi:Bacterial mobilisation protein (MobC)